MKKTNSFTHKLLVGAVALAITGLAVVTAKADDIAQVITVAKVEGAARFSTDNHSWQTLRRGDTLHQGAIIQTADGSSVDLFMGDAVNASGPSQVYASIPNQATGRVGGGGFGAVTESGAKPNFVHVFESSVVSVDKLLKERTGIDEVAETELDLRSGRVLGNVKKLSAASHYEVKIPTGVAGIRGTTYTVNASGVVYVLSGSVVISYVGAGGVNYSQVVPAGSSFNPFLNNGVMTPTAGPGTVAPIPAAVLAALSKTIPPNTAPQNPTINATVIHISPN